MVISLRGLRMVWGRLRTDWAFLGACWLLVATATTLVTAGALYADTVELGGVRRALAEADPANQGVLVRTSAKASEIGKLDAAVRPVLAGSFDDAGADVILTTRSASLIPALGGQPGVAADSAIGQQLVVLGAYEDIDKHASLAAGAWPTPGKTPMEAVVSEKAAAALFAELGSRLQFADGATPRADPTAVVADVQIVGIWRPNRSSDPYWLGDPLDLEGRISGATSTRGPVLVAPEDLTASATAAGVDMRWRALPNVDELRLNRVDQLRADLGAIPAAIKAVMPDARNVTVNTKLADVLGTIDQSVAVSRSGVVLVILQFVLLAGYAVLLAGALLVERRRAEVALLRARGARASQVGLLAVAESLAIALPAALLAPLIALGVISFIGNVGAVGDAGIISAPSLSVAVLAVTALAGLACVVVLSLPALVSDVDLAHVRAAIGRPLGRTLAQRVGLDLVLLVITAIGLFELQSYGSPLARGANGQFTIDPILVAAPALSLAAGALLVIRIVPRSGELADRLLHRLRGLTLTLASSEIARRPLRYTRTALLVVLAAALATFAATYTSTWADSQADQARYQAGADIRLPINPQSALGTPEGTASIVTQPGVRVAAPVIRDRVDIGRTVRGIDALILDANTVAQNIELPAGESQSKGMAALNAIGGTGRFDTLAFPPATKRAAVVLDVALRSSDERFPFLPDAISGQGVQVSAQFTAAGDQLVQATGLAQTYDSRAARVVLPIPGADALPATSTGAAAPPGLLDLHVQGIVPIQMSGDITVLRIEASPSANGDADWATVASAADLPGWSFPTGATLHFDDNAPLVPVDQFGVDRPQIYRFGPATAAIDDLQLIANDAFLKTSGAAVGDVISVAYHSATFEAKVAASVADFPSLDPTKPFLIIDRFSLRVAAQGLGASDPKTNEWWLWTEPGAQENVAETLAAPPISSTDFVSAAHLRQSLERDPVALGLVGALLLGSLAAAICAAVGLIVGAIVSTRERRTETALLRALGMSRRGVTTSVVIDNGYLLAFGLPAGIGLGILIALLVLPHTPLNRTGAQVVPTPQVVVPFDAVGALVGIAVLLLLVTIAAASRVANRAAIADVLRAPDA